MPDPNHSLYNFLTLIAGIIGVVGIIIAAIRSVLGNPKGLKDLAKRVDALERDCANEKAEKQEAQKRHDKEIVDMEREIAAVEARAQKAIDRILKM